MRTILLSAILVVLAITASAQTTTTANVNSPCQLAFNKSPSIRGIKLGMKLDDVLHLFPQAEENEWVKTALQQKANYPNFGVVHFFILPSSYPTKEQFRGISQFSFTFIDDRLAQYSVEYSAPPDGPVWPRVEDWVTKVAESFELPAISSWTVEQSGGRTLMCNGFQVRASNMNLRGNLNVATGELPYKEQQARRAAFEEKLRRDFKP